MRIARVMAVAAVALGVAGAATEVCATKPHSRTGFFIGFGLGGGNASWDWALASTESPSENSGIANLRLGGAVREDLVLGYEGSSWVKEYDIESGGVNVGDAKVTFSASTFAATWFPRNVGFFLRGGVGIATAKGEVKLRLNDDLDPFELVGLDGTDTGVAVLGATGYEWRLTDKFALGPQVELVFLGIDGDVVDNVAIVDGSVQFNWYW